ncbi:hypothetical protein [Scopulibacillus daqui]|uniref:hypothetical protein n=1 Tax=Scopulibacillus daqui TaxID=1469162 RepID=UPI001961A126|nr:hypothetical protein [Scopulibacillus daqui]
MVKSPTKVGKIANYEKSKKPRHYSIFGSLIGLLLLTLYIEQTLLPFLYKTFSQNLCHQGKEKDCHQGNRIRLIGINNIIIIPTTVTDITLIKSPFYFLR